MKMLKYLNLKFERFIFEVLDLYNEDNRGYDYLKMLIINTTIYQKIVVYIYIYTFV